MSESHWHTLCPGEALAEGQSKQFTCHGIALFVVKQGNAVYAYQNRCPHLGIELQWLPDQFLDAEREFIQCSTHGALFLIDDGECIAGPCRGQSLRRLPCRLRAGHIDVQLPATSTLAGA